MSAVLLQHHPYVLSMLSLPLCDLPAKAPPQGSTQCKLKQSRAMITVKYGEQTEKMVGN